MRSLPLGVLRGLSDALWHRDFSGLLRACAIVVGLFATVAGYLRGMFSTQKIELEQPALIPLAYETEIAATHSKNAVGTRFIASVIHQEQEQEDSHLNLLQR
jgi:hypothetical protein